MKQSLRFRLHLLLLLVAAPGILFVLYQGLAERDRILEISETRAEEVTTLLVTNQKARIVETRRTLLSIAQSPFVQEPASAECEAYLGALLPFMPELLALGVARPDGEMVCGAGPTVNDVNLADRSYFQTAIRDHAFSVGSFQVDRITGLPSLNFAYPIRKSEDSEPVGVAIAVVGLGRWSTNLVRRPLPDDLQLVIHDGAQNILAVHPYESSLLGEPLASAGFPSTLASDDRPMTAVGSDGVKRTYFNQRLFSDGAGHGVWASVGVPFNISMQQTGETVLGRLLTLTLVLAAAWWMVGRMLAADIVRPLRALSESVESMQVGQSGAAELPDRNGPVREIDHLGRGLRVLVDARDAAEQAEKRRTQELEALIDAIPDMFFRIDAADRILDWRAGTESDLLATPTEFLGRPITEFLPPEANRLHERNMRRHRETGEIVSWEYRLDFGGQTRLYEARACPSAGTNESILVVRNVTERRRNEEALRTAGLVYGSSSEGMIVTDANGRIETANPAIAEETGYAAKELVGRPFYELVSEQERAQLLDKLETPSGSSAWKGEVRLRRVDGDTYPAWLTVNEIRDPAGRLRRRVILSRDMTELKAANEAVMRQTRLDTLTGLPNRNSLKTELQDRCLDAEADGRQIVLLFIDIDRLRQVNDRLGHLAGDAALVTVARRLKDCIAPQDFVARQTGDEFIVLLGGDDAQARAREVVDRILESIARPFVFGETVAHLSASIGMATFPKDAGDSYELLAAADQAMMAAKSDGRNRSRLFSPEIRQNTLDRIRLLDDIQNGLDNGQFVLHYQPIVEIGTGRISKAEALMRWNHPDLGSVSPHRFIPMAEKARMIGPLGDWSLDRACTDLPQLQDRFGKAFQVSLNLSPVQLAPGPDKSGVDWAARIAGSGLDRGALAIEITEGALLDSHPDVTRRLESLRDAGADLALDDFGVGYSSMLYFLHHHFDILKIDREFVQGLESGGKPLLVCESILHFARSLGCVVIAEGIETPAQFAALKRAECDFGQGYFFSPALPLDELLRLPEILKPS